MCAPPRSLLDRAPKRKNQAPAGLRPPTASGSSLRGPVGQEIYSIAVEFGHRTDDRSVDASQAEPTVSIIKSRSSPIS